ncbi:MAG: P-loop NTPase [Acidimicrobiia bacterium]
MLEGWSEVTSSLLAASPLTVDELDVYYGGGAPEWPHAVAEESRVPRRGHVAGAVAALTAAEGPTMVLLVGPAGGGQSTSLRQAVADLARSGHRVLFRGPDAGLDPDAVPLLPDGPLVLASDEVGEIARAVEAAARAVSAAGRRDVHWLLAGREGDLKEAFREHHRAAEPAWEQIVALWPGRGERAATMALTPTDAVKVVAAWDAQGRLGLLESTPASERAELLRDRASAPEGSLLGATIDLRIGTAALRAHVAGRMAGLGTGARDAFLYAAAADAAGIDGVDLTVVADLVGVGRAERHGRLQAPLQAVGLATGSGDAFRARHRSLAVAAVTLIAGGEVERDLETVYTDLVHATGAAGSDAGLLVSEGPVLSCGPVLAGRLRGLGVEAADADRVAAAVARTAVAVRPELLVLTLALGLTHRKAGDLAAASAVLRAALATVEERRDWRDNGRNYLGEMSLGEAADGRRAPAIVLAGLSVVDTGTLGPVFTLDAKRAMAAMGSAAMGMDELATEAAFPRLLRACSDLGAAVSPRWDERTRAAFHRFGVRAEEAGVPSPSSGVALDWVRDAIVAARRLGPDPEVDALWQRLVGVDAVARFRLLATALGPGMRR